MKIIVRRCVITAVTKEKVDASRELLDVISCINETHGKFKTSEVINILRGSMTAILSQNNADQLENWGKHKGKSETHLRAVIRQGIIRHYLEKNIESYGTVQVTEKEIHVNYRRHSGVERIRLYDLEQWRQ